MLENACFQSCSRATCFERDECKVGAGGGDEVKEAGDGVEGVVMGWRG